MDDKMKRALAAFGVALLGLLLFALGGDTQAGELGGLAMIAGVAIGAVLLVSAAFGSSE